MWAKLLALPQSPAWDRWVFLGFVVLAVLGVGVLWKVPQWQVARVEGLDSKERFDKRNEARKTLATILGGVAFLTGGYFTWRNFNLAQESLRVSQQGQITDRFTKAIEQLGAVDSQGKPKFEVRLGGIYSLEAIAKDSKDLHWPIMEVLCSYVRGNAPAQPLANAASADQKKSGSQGTTSQHEVHPCADIQAILTVLGRRDAWQEHENQRLDLSGTNLVGADLYKAHLERADFTQADLRWARLRGAYLGGAYLGGAYLNRANLSGADLSGAYLIGVDLREADLSGANLSRADLNGADLSGSDFARADLTRADLIQADLTQADLTRANLSGADLSLAELRGADLRVAVLREADLSGVDLSTAMNLTQEQVNSARGNVDTKLPANFCLPRNWIDVKPDTARACPAPK